MGRKVHPMGFRIGIIRDWQAKWYADKHYGEFLQEDLKIRQAIQSRYAEAAISQVDIDRQANRVWVTIYTARPGIVIGRGGQRVDETRLYLEKLVGKRVQLNIQEVQRAELDAYLVARMVADQMEHRVNYRRAMKQAIFRTIQAGAKGIKISCSGRLGGADIARRQVLHEGRVPLQTLRADIDYGFAEASTALSQIGVKVWIYKGDILPEPKMVEIEEAPVELVAGEDMEAAPLAEPEVMLEPKEIPAETVAGEDMEVAPLVEPEVMPEPEKIPAETVASESVEAAPLAEPEGMLEPKEIPVELVAGEDMEAVPLAEPEGMLKPEEIPAETVAGEDMEAAPLVEPEGMLEPKEIPAETVAGEDMEAAPLAEPEVMPESEKIPAETVASESVETVSPAEPGEILEQEKTLAEAVESAPVELEEKDATTEAGEIPQDS